MAASAGPGEVLFQRGVNDGDTSIWDDTALVKAYDQAVNAIKMAVNDPSVPMNGERKQKHQKKMKKHKKVKSKQGSVKTWKVGDYCKAVYSEDGYSYEAIITSINPSRGTCMVKYRGYGNEEEQRLKDLVTLDNGNASITNTSDTEADILSDVERADAKWSLESLTTSSRSASVNSVNGRRSREQSFKEESKAPSMVFDCFGNLRSDKPFGRSNSHVPPFTFPFPMNANPSTCPGAFGGASSSAFPPPPMMPLIPPPILPDLGSLADEKDALYGMLISWYMSGYHTGYYQCLKQMRKTRKPDLDGDSVASNSHPAKGTTKAP